MFQFIRNSTLYKKTITFIDKVSATTDRLCSSAYHFTRDAWNTYNSDRVHYSTHLNTLSMFIIVLGTSTLTFICTSPFFSLFLGKMPWSYLLISCCATNALSLLTLKNRLHMFLLALLDGFASARMLSLHFKTQLIDQILIEFRKDHKPQIQELQQIFLLIESQESEAQDLEIRESKEQESKDRKPEEHVPKTATIRDTQALTLTCFVNQNSLEATDFARKLSTLTQLLTQGSMTGLQENITWIEVIPADHFNEVYISMFRRRMIPNQAPDFPRLSPENQAKIGSEIPLLQAYYFFLEGKDKREYQDLSTFHAFRTKTELPPTVAGTVISYLPFPHPIFKHQTQERNTNTSLREKIIDFRSREIQQLATTLKWPRVKA